MTLIIKTKEISLPFKLLYKKSQTVTAIIPKPSQIIHGEYSSIFSQHYTTKQKNVTEDNIVRTVAVTGTIIGQKRAIPLISP